MHRRPKDAIFSTVLFAEHVFLLTWAETAEAVWPAARGADTVPVQVFMMQLGMLTKHIC